MNIDETKRKKVLFLITKSNWGGAQKYVYDLATNLPVNSYESVVLTGGEGNLITELKKTNIRTISLPSLQRDVSLTKEILSLVKIYKIIKSEQPDIIHVNSSKAGALGALLGRLTGVPRIIFTAHGWAFNENRSLVSKITIKFLHWLTVILSHQTIAVSAAVKKQMDWPFVQSKMVVIHNGLKVPNYEDKLTARNFLIAKIPNLKNFTNDFWTVTIGELHKTKQHHITIEAIAQLKKETDVNLRHLIIGTGDEENYLKNLIVSLNLQDNIFLVGKVDEAAKYLKAFDLFILSSISEALAYVIIEAAQAKLPIIASKVGGIPEIITDNVEGYLVPSGDISTLTKAIKNCLDNPSDCIQKSKAAKIKSKDFCLEKMLEETLTLYANTISSE